MLIKSITRQFRRRIGTTSLPLESGQDVVTASLIIAVAFITTTDVVLITPNLSAIQRVFDVSATRVSLVVTVYAIPSVIMAPVIGYVADRLGRRRILAACLALFGTAGLSITLASSFQTILLLRAIQGLAAGSILASLALTLVGDCFSGERREVMMGVTAAVISIGAAIYPTVGGYLSTISWRAPFAVYSVSLPLALCAYLVLEPDPPDGRSDEGYLVGAFRELPLGRLGWVYGLLAAGFIVMFGGVYVLLPLALRTDFGLTSVDVGLVSSFVLGVTAVTSTQSGRLGTIFTRRARLTIGFGGFGVGLLALGIASSVPLVLLTLTAVGIGMGVMTPTLFVIISDLAPTRYRAGVMSLRTTTVGLSQTIGPVAFTEMSGVLGYQAVFVTGGVVLAAIGTLVFFAPSKG